MGTVLWIAVLRDRDRSMRAPGCFGEGGVCRVVRHCTGRRQATVHSGVAQGVQYADSEQQQSEQYETQGDAARLHTAAHAPRQSVRRLCRR